VDCAVGEGRGARLHRVEVNARLRVVPRVRLGVDEEAEALDLGWNVAEGLEKCERLSSGLARLDLPADQDRMRRLLSQCLGSKALVGSLTGKVEHLLDERALVVGFAQASREQCAAAKDVKARPPVPTGELSFELVDVGTLARAVKRFRFGERITAEANPPAEFVAPRSNFVRSREGSFAKGRIVILRATVVALCASTLIGCSAASRSLPQGVASPSIAYYGSRGEARGPLRLGDVRFWAYQIDDMSVPGSVRKLVNSRYDMLVLEPWRTIKGYEDFDAASMVAAVRSSPAHDGMHRKLALAYLDVGEAEQYRWYFIWKGHWHKGGHRPPGWPSFILEPDPDGWGGSFPVAFWRREWQDIIINGIAPPKTQNYDSVVDEAVKDGFDGIYLDWVQAWNDPRVVQAAKKDGVDPAEAMIAFIKAMRAYAALRHPGFLVVQQNAPDLGYEYPKAIAVVDAIAVEDIWYYGKANAKWGDPRGYDQPVSKGYTRQLLTWLPAYERAGLPVFDVEYTLHHVATVYPESKALGFVPYCTQVSLSRLTTTPPSGY
jgi:cysteinyl-tRNA synthetase, unknown class